MGERKIHDLLEVALPFLIQMNVPKIFWNFAIGTICHIINHTHSNDGSQISFIHPFSYRKRRFVTYNCSMCMVNDMTCSTDCEVPINLRIILRNPSWWSHDIGCTYFIHHPGPIVNKLASCVAKLSFWSIYFTWKGLFLLFPF